MTGNGVDLSRQVHLNLAGLITCLTDSLINVLNSTE
jgi:hypothetical protein